MVGKDGDFIVGSDIGSFDYRKKLKDLNVVAMVGDYTHFPENITAELSRYNRAGVPLVLVYPKNPDAAPIVLPELLTPGTILDALNQTTHK